MTNYVNPVPGGKVGRTDQGVDISAPPGTPILAIAKETLVGVIQNWYNGQPFYWFKIAGSNMYDYVAEQVSIKVQPGQTVEAGQEIGVVAQSGTGLELGYATASGQTLARATTGYTEGEVTPAGQRYRNEVIAGGRIRPGGQPPDASGSGSSGPSAGSQILQGWAQLRDMPRTAPPGEKSPFKWWLSSFTDKWSNVVPAASGGSAGTGSATDNGAGPPSAGGYSFQQLVSLWEQAGGSPGSAHVAAAVALAESGGDPKNRYNPGSQEDSRGLWQINVAGSANPQYASQNLYDPLTNAKIAVAMSHNGTNWNPWTTFTSGKYRQFLQ